MAHVSSLRFVRWRVLSTVRPRQIILASDVVVKPLVHIFIDNTLRTVRVRLHNICVQLLDGPVLLHMMLLRGLVARVERFAYFLPVTDVDQL